MLNVIKTAIVTIIISFISGVLLDYYKNYAPRIVCNIGKGKIIRKNDKKVKIYSVTIKNISKKTVHDLNINITAQCDKLKLHGTKITSGLRFEILDEDNMYNIRIPFLSNNDGFLSKIILENPGEMESKPVINLKSPENFKRIDLSKNKKDDNGHSIIKNINDVLEKVFYNNRKVILGFISLLIVVFIGILAGEHYGDSINNQNKVYKKAGVENTLNNNSNESDVIGTTSNTSDEAMQSSGEYEGSEEEILPNDYSTSSYNDANNVTQPIKDENYDTSKSETLPEEYKNTTVDTTEQSSGTENMGSTDGGTTADTTENSGTTSTTDTDNGVGVSQDGESGNNDTEDTTGTSNFTTDTSNNTNSIGTTTTN